MSWADMSQEDAAEGDIAAGVEGYVATAEELAVADSDPDLAVPVDTELASDALAALVPAPSSLLP
jgi:hypothetical protein